MRWKLFATLAEAAGDNEVDVSVDAGEATLREAFDALLATYPDLERHVLDEDGSLQDHVRLLCDGEDPFRERDGWETDLSGVGELALFPPVSGG
jgi:molybdopterin synthase sulfur carrier subunit